MPFSLPGAAAGSALFALSASSALWQWAAAPGPSAPRGCDVEDDPEHPGFVRYRVRAHDGRVIACGHIERHDADARLPLMMQAFLDRRDPLPAPAPNPAPTPRPLALLR
jgi:hypothetical protein